MFAPRQAPREARLESYFIACDMTIFISRRTYEREDQLFLTVHNATSHSTHGVKTYTQLIGGEPLASLEPYIILTTCVFTAPCMCGFTFR